MKNFPLYCPKCKQESLMEAKKLQDLIIEEMVTKVNYQMEAIRRFNYPYQALLE